VTSLKIEELMSKKTTGTLL